MPGSAVMNFTDPQEDRQPFARPTFGSWFQPQARSEQS